MRGFVTHVDVGDVCFGRCQRGGHTGKYAFAVDDSHQNIALKRPHRVVRPIHRDETFAVFVAQFAGDGATRGVDNQAFTTSEVTHNLVARDRAAARGILDRCVLATVQRHNPLADRFVRSKALTRQQQCVRLFAGFFGQQGDQPLADDAGDAFA